MSESGEPRLKPLLRARTKVDLISLSKRLGLNLQSKLTKEKIIDEVLKVREGKLKAALGIGWWNKNRNAVFGWSSIVGLLITVATVVATCVPDRIANPNLAIGWYQLVDGQPQLIRPTDVKVKFDEETVENQRIKIPLNLAIRNAGKDPLEIVTIEFGYPSWLDINSSGRQKIHPNQKWVVYEHNIGTLSPTESFLPIQTVDTISVGFPSTLTDIFTKMKGGVPMYHSMIIGAPQNKLVGRPLKFEFRIHCKDHSTVEGNINLEIPPLVEIISLTDHTEIESIEHHEFRTLLQETADGKIEDSWETIYPDDQSKIGYKKLRSGSKTIYAAYVEDVLRTMNVDEDSDGALEFYAWDDDGDGIIDQKAIFTAFVPAVDWKKSVVEKIVDSPH